MIRRSTILALLAGAALIGPPVLAQDAPPPDAAPVQSAPADQPALPSPTDAAPPAPAPPSAPVEAQPLATLDLFSSGRDTGLGADFWKGSSAALARAVIPTLAQRRLSPAAAVLARRVLANAATAPGDAGADAGLAAARASALLTLGDAADVGAILDRTPGVSGDAGLSQVAAEAALISDQPDKACQIGQALTAGRDGLYWLRLRAYCQARDGKGPQAQLTLSIASQAGADADYQRLMGALLDSHAQPGAASLSDGVNYALSHQLALDLKPALATAPLAIAEHVRAMGPSAPPPPAPGAAPAPPPPPGEADVLVALRAAKTQGDYVAAAKGQADAIAALVRAKAPLTAPVQIATAALVVGDLASAQAIRASLTPDGANKTDLAILDAALAVADKPDAALFDPLAALGAADGPDKTRAQAAAAIYAAYAGAPAPGARAALAEFNIGHGAGTDSQFLALDLAAQAQARGDVAMLSLSLAEVGGIDGPVAADRVWLERALLRSGLVADARGFALEGLIALQSR